MTINEFSNAISWHIYQEDIIKAANTIKFVSGLNIHESKHIIKLCYSEWERQHKLGMKIPDVGVLIYYYITTLPKAHNYCDKIQRCNFVDNFENL